MKRKPNFSCFLKKVFFSFVAVLLLVGLKFLPPFFLFIFFFSKHRYLFYQASNMLLFNTTNVYNHFEVETTNSSRGRRWSNKRKKGMKNWKVERMRKFPEDFRNVQSFCVVHMNINCLLLSLISLSFRQQTVSKQKHPPMDDDSSTGWTPCEYIRFNSATSITPHIYHPIFCLFSQCPFEIESIRSLVFIIALLTWCTLSVDKEPYDV